MVITSVRIRELRKKRGLTQKQIAQKINVSPQVISNWERNYSSLNNDDIKKIVKALDTTSAYLLGEDEKGTTLEEGKRLFLEEFQRMSKEDQEYIAGLVKRLPKV